MISYLRYWWFKIGIKAGWITDSYCATHDGGYEYMSEEDRQEMEEGGRSLPSSCNRAIVRIAGKR